MTLPQPPRRDTALAWATSRLRDAGIDEPRLDATLLLCAAQGIGRTALISAPEAPLAADEAAAFAAMVARRAAHEPVSRILGHREFWSLDFRLSAATLDPRPDSEILVEAVLDRLDDRARPWRLVDLGTGSGCLLLTLLHELPQARGLGIDRAPGAVAMAAENAAMLGLAGRAAFREGDWLAGVTETFDVVLSNPPYIASAEIATLAPEVRLHDPQGALDGGADGLDAYRALLPQAAARLAPAGLCAVEIGHDQAAAVATLMQAAGFAVEPVLTDLGGRDRVVVGRRKNLLE
ncbi:MAG: peptide chain release factor N(5)-glutamine methyltransferase [Alphaproteobacteria bacterium]|jgi:release factor glutamine methyltransferase|nr:peptide chain release factor N(5)-glutamine methyltransferase [Alphaproteobacteria bacterium]